MTRDIPLTVVIPTLDEAEMIEDCLASVGIGPGVTVVVSDGGSADGTPELVRGIPHVRVVCGPPGRGPQLNRGAAATDSPLLLFLHADCRLPVGWARALRVSLAVTETALVCFRLRTEPSRAAGGAGARATWLRLLDLRSFGLGLPYGDQGFGLRRETFDAVGGFPEIPLMEDLVMARACRRLGRIHRLELAIRTTARRYEAEPMRTRLMTATFPLLFRLGVSPRKLARWYGGAR